MVSGASLDRRRVSPPVPLLHRLHVRTSCASCATSGARHRQRPRCATVTRTIATDPAADAAPPRRSRRRLHVANRPRGDATAARRSTPPWPQAVAVRMSDRPAPWFSTSAQVEPGPDADGDADVPGGHQPSSISMARPSGELRSAIGHRRQQRLGAIHRSAQNRDSYVPRHEQAHGEPRSPSRAWRQPDASRRAAGSAVVAGRITPRS